MQNAKDTFYELLRQRLAAVSPERTVVVRGVTRPGLLVDENEFQAAALLLDCFHLRWTEVHVDARGGLTTCAMICEIFYATAGTPESGGLDRGRTLSTMDGELLSTLRQLPRNVVKADYSAGVSGKPLSMKTRVWWNEVSFGEIKPDRNCCSRVATVIVSAYQEEGEL